MEYSKMNNVNYVNRFINHFITVNKISIYFYNKNIFLFYRIWKKEMKETLDFWMFQKLRGLLNAKLQLFDIYHYTHRRSLKNHIFEVSCPIGESGRANV